MEYTWANVWVTSLLEKHYPIENTQQLNSCHHNSYKHHSQAWRVNHILVRLWLRRLIDIILIEATYQPPGMKAVIHSTGKSESRPQFCQYFYAEAILCWRVTHWSHESYLCGWNYPHSDIFAGSGPNASQYWVTMQLGLQQRYSRLSPAAGGQNVRDN